MGDDEDTEDINKRINKSYTNIMTILNTENKAFISWNTEVLSILQKTKKEYEELNKEIETLSHKCKNVKLDCDNMCETLDKKNIELEGSKTEMKNLDSKYNSLLKEYERINQECIKNKKQTELSTVDKNILNLSRKKLELYGQISNIIWDYSEPLMSATISGYIRNKGKNYINAFEFKRKELSTFDLREKLWKEIELGSGEDWSDIVAMTDLSSNN